MTQLRNRIFNLLFARLGDTRTGVVTRHVHGGIRLLANFDGECSIPRRVAVDVNAIFSANSAHGVSLIVARTSGTLHRTGDRKNGGIVVRRVWIRGCSRPYFLHNFYVRFVAVAPGFPLPDNTRVDVVDTPIPNHGQALSNFLISLARKIPFVVGLRREVLQRFVTTDIVILASSFLVFRLITDSETVDTCLHCVIRGTSSSFLCSGCRGRDVTTRIVHTLTTRRSRISPRRQHTVYRTFRSTGGARNLGLATRGCPNLHNALRATSASYSAVIRTTTLLPTFSRTIRNGHRRSSCNSNLKVTRRGFRCCLSLGSHCICFCRPIGIRCFTVGG